MSLTFRQRLDRIDVRIEELECWVERETVNIDGWRFEGEAIEVGGFWPRKEGVVKMAARATVPDHWPLGDTRLKLDVGGESLIALLPAGGGGALDRFGVDPFHRSFPVPSSEFAIDVDAVARLPFGESVPEPRFNMAKLAWIDRPVEELALLLRQVSETVHFLVEDH